MRFLVLFILASGLSLHAQSAAQIASCASVYDNVYATGRHSYLMTGSSQTSTAVSGVVNDVDSPYTATIRQITMALSAVMAQLKSPGTATSAYPTACATSTLAWLVGMKTSWDPVTGYPPDVLATLAQNASALKSSVAP